jgi:UDP-4-amino-4-deoxy-L-arabinose formyltransferase / UDP-glucuronic acid dehydrogenase (UDP-4-keto-hexauronic acid decarboxylating)
VDCISRIIENQGGVCDRQIFNIGTPENEVTIQELANKMCATFDKHFCQPGDPYPEIISVPSEEFYGKGYEDCDRRIPMSQKPASLLTGDPSMISIPCCITR